MTGTSSNLSTVALSTVARLALIALLFIASREAVAVEPTREQPAHLQFWSFQPIRNPEPPQIEAEQINNDIDRYVMARLRQANLKPMNSATKRVLIRRATFDLTGLPPTPEDIQSFVDDETPDAFAKVVDRLLQSKAYGERWGRHWLDVVRYADTAGETGDYPTPLSYKYRNWVINALNDDKPYDQFIREQIAGDILAQQDPNPSHEQYRDMRTATGFIAISRRFGFDVENYHHLTIQDTIDTLGQSVLGLSLGCARCHDHKYDPVDINDYYAWYGIFESTRYSFPGSEQKKRPYDLFPALPPQIAAARKVAHDTELANIESEIKALEQEQRDLSAKLSALGRGSLGFELQPLGEQPGEPWGSHESARIVESAQSPYSNVLSIGTRGIAFPRSDANTHFVRKIVPSRKAADSPKLYFNIDFRNTGQATGTNGSYRFYLGRGPGHSAAVELAASATTIFAKNGATFQAVRALKVGQWYNLQLAIDLRAKIYSGSIGQPGDVTAFEGKAFTTGWDGTIDHFFVDKYGHLGGITSAREFDNYAVGTSHFLPVDKSAGESAAGASSNSWRPYLQVAEARDRNEMLAERLSQLKTRRDEMKRNGPYDVIYGAIEQDKPQDAQIRIRGERYQLGDEVPRKNLEILGNDPLPAAAGSGRLELADWLTRADNPLMARVMVNRIWQHHFGRGLVGTVNDFGARGERPTHPDLLDWLASRFKESGYSIKAMHRLMMASATYQRSSDFDARAAEADPDSRLLWRFNRRRLSAEEIRDAMLLASGDLDATMGGEHPFPPVEKWGFTQHAPYYGVYPTNRRSIYLMQQRLKRHPFLGLFDGADPNVSTGRRELTTVPTQALYLMNNEFVHERAARLAKRLLAAADDEAARIKQAYRIVFGRLPSDDEIADDVSFLQRYTAALAATEVPEKDRQLAAWSGLARSVLTRNEFLFVD